MFRHRAELALRKTFGSNGKGTVEAGARIFPADNGGEFDKLALRKMPPQLYIEVVWYIGWCLRHGHGKPKNDLLLIVEILAGFELSDIVQLVFGDSGFSAHGRVNVDSKRAPDHQSGFELREFFEVNGNRAI